MSTGPITLRPGIDVVKTPLLNEGGFSDSNLIRWFNGLLQKLGGCTRLSATPVSGIATALHPFSDLSGNNYIGIGTSTNIQLYAAQADVKPSATSNLSTTNITMTAGSKSVTVVDTSYSPAVGQTVTFTNTLLPQANAGPLIQGSVVVTSVNSGANSWTFDLPDVAPVDGNPITLGFFSENGSTYVPIFPQADVSWLVGQNINIAFSVSLPGSGLTPAYISPGMYLVSQQVIGVSEFIVIQSGSSTNASATIVHQEENGGNANIVYSAFTVYASGSVNNIPPPNTTVNLSTTAISLQIGSKVVTVTDASYTPYVGQTVTFNNALLQAGVSASPLIQGNVTVTSVNEVAGTWTFNLPSNASSTTVETLGFFSVDTSKYVALYPQADVAWLVGSNITIKFTTSLPGSGLTPASIAAGTYPVSIQTIGITNYVVILSSSSTNASSTIVHQQENGGNANITYVAPSNYSGVWSLDNWGQNLVGAPQGGPLYSWTPPLPAVSEIVNGAPHYNTAVFVAMPQQQIISCGSDAGGYLDQLLVRWSDVGDYTSSTAWTALTTNQAGSFRLSSGSLIVGALQGPQQGFIWTDVDMWVMQYIGFPLVYSFNRVGQACGLLSKRAATQIGGALWWLGKKGAFYYDGQSVKPLPCPVWDYFWNNVDQNNLQSVFAAENSDFNEVAWYFPTTSSAGVPTNYIKLNILNPSQPVWDYGVLTRDAWCDRSVIGPAVGVDANNLLQQHETSNDLDGVAMDSWATTGWFKLAEGQDFITIKRIIWDSIIQGSGSPEMLVTVYVANYPNDTPSVYGPYTVTDATQYITVKARGRIARLKFESVDLGSFWRLGQPIFVISNSGRR